MGRYFHFLANFLILPTTVNRFLKTSSFLKRTILNPNSDKAFSRLASSSCCRSWTSPSTSTTNADLSKTPCGLYGVTVKVNDEPLNDLLPPKADSQLIRV